MKSHAGFRFVPNPMTLNDLERRNSPYFAFFTKFDSFADRLYHSVSEYRFKIGDFAPTGAG